MPEALSKRDKMVTLTFMVLTIMLIAAKAVPVEITQQPPGIEENPRQVAFTVHFTREYVNIGSGEPIKFDENVTNIGNGYNLNTGIFTAPISGIYTFNLQIKCEIESYGVEAGVNADGIIVCKARAENVFGFCYANVHLNKGQIVFAQQTSGYSRVYGMMYSMFSGVMVSYDIIK